MKRLARLARISIAAAQPETATRTLLYLSGIFASCLLLTACAVTNVKDTDGVSKPIEYNDKDKTRSIEIVGPDSSKKVLLNLTATDMVSDGWIEYLMENIQIVPVQATPGDSTMAFWSENVGVIDYQYPDVKLELVIPEQNREEGILYIYLWPEVFTALMPGVLRVDPFYGAEPPSSDNEVGVVAAALGEGEFTAVNGRLTCSISDISSSSTRPLPFAAVLLDGEEVVTADATGAFSLPGSFADPGSIDVVVRFLSPVPDASGGFSTPLEVMDEFQHSRNTTVSVPTSIVGDVIALGTVDVTHPDCELWNIGVQLLNRYHRAHVMSPPANRLRIKRWSDINVGTPHTFYDYIVLTKDYVINTDSATRMSTLNHEFGHSIRHVADGPQHHWDWDNFRYAYARDHSIDQLAREQFAFNEGFAQYYRIEAGYGFRLPSLDPVHDVGGANRLEDFLDWNEGLIGQHLKRMSDAVTTTPRGVTTMVNILRNNPGSIHRLRDFEVQYCRVEPASNPFCGSSMRPAPQPCPPGYHNDGPTCRLPDVLAKNSYGRGAGSVPTTCPPGRNNEAGLCYVPCRPGFDGAAFLCVRDCRAGYHDDGLSCRRDVQIIASDNSGCPWWDVCGVGVEEGCSVCPPGFQNDGCTCRIDTDVYFKDSYDRGVGTIPNRCGGGREYQNGLCYEQCAAGFDGEGPVCWAPCPVGYRDDGWTCWHGPHIIGQ